MRTKRVFVLLFLLMLGVVLTACQTTTTTTTTATTPTTTTTTTTTSSTTTTTTTIPTTTTTTLPPTTTTTTTTIPLPAVLPLLTGWVDADGVHQITYGTNRMDITYNKNGFSWAAMSKEITQSLARFNKLVFTVSGSGTMMVKIQGETSAVEVSVPVTAGAVTYQVNLRDDDAFLAGVSQVLIFAAPGKAQGEGTIAITKFEFDEGTAFGNVLEKGENRIPQNQLEYNGTGDIFDFAIGFEDNGDGVYTVDKTGGKVIVSYNKSGFSWAFMRSQMTGRFSDFDYVVLEVRGITAGSVLLKAELPGIAVEKGVSFAADETVKVFIDLTAWTNEQMDAITKILVFAAGGNTTATGSFEILGAYFAKTVEVDPPYSFNQGWVDNDSNTYAFAEGTNGSVIVTYTKVVGQEWAFFKTTFDPEKALGLNTLKITLKGAAGTSALLKPNNANNLEQTATFTSTDPVTLTFSADAFVDLLIFVQPNIAPSTGTIEILSVELSYVLPNALDPSVKVDFSTGWVDNTGGIYTFNRVGDITIVNWNRQSGENWSIMKYNFTQNLANHNTITMVVKGEAGKQLIIKPNDKIALEKTITFTGEAQEVVFTLAERLTLVYIFVDPILASTSGSFEILKAEVSYVGEDVNFNTGWVQNDPNTYTFTEGTNGSVLVNYTKGAGQEWVFMKTEFNANDVQGLNTLTIVLKGTPGKSVMIKPNDSNALEQTITFTDANPVTVVVKAPAFTKFMIFAEPGVASVNGSFEIVSLTITFEEEPAVNPSVVVDFKTGWVDNDGGIYTFNVVNNATVVSWSKAANQSWAFIRYNFEQNLSNHNTITMVLKGEAGKQLIIKPNDNFLYEQTVTFTGEEQTVVFTLKDRLTRVLIFVDPIGGSLSGQFEIIKAEVSYVNPSSFNTGWVENDPGTYQITEQVGGSILVSYNKSTFAWALMKTTFTPSETLGLNTLTVTVKGTDGKQLLIKPNNSNLLEQMVTFNGEIQTFIFTADQFFEVFLFAEPNTEAVSGTFEILALTLTFVPIPPVDPSVVVGFLQGWTDNDGGIFTFNHLEGITQVSYVRTANQAWAFIKFVFNQDLSNHNTITMVVKGEAGKQLIIKPNDNFLYEQTVTFTGAEQTIVFTLTDRPDKVLIFVDPINGSLTGSFEILKAEVTFYDPTDFNSGWVENTANTYQVVEQPNGSYLVSYTKGASQGTVSLKNIFNAEQAAPFNTMTIVLKGTPGKSVAVRPNNSATYQQIVEFTDDQPKTLTISGAFFTSLYLIAESGVASVSGSFEILSLHMSTISIPTGQGANPFLSMPYVLGFWNPLDNTSIHTLRVKDAISHQFLGSAIRYSKADLPVGTILIIEAGYQVRFNFWTNLEGDALARRSDNITNSVIVIDEAWWGTQNYVAFNLSPTTAANITLRQQEVASKFHIILPYQELDMDFVSGFYNSTSSDASRVHVVSPETDSLHYRFIVPNYRYSKAELPVGSIILLEPGYQYRPNFWNTLSSPASENFRFAQNVTTNMVIVTEAWWSTYNYVSFNLSQVGTPDIRDQIDFVATKLKVLIPGSAIQTVSGEVGYYDSTVSHNINNTAPDAIYSVSISIRFSKADLPNGTILVIQSGYQYIANFYETLDGTLDGNRKSAPITTRIVVIDDAFWGEQDFVAFTIQSTTASTDLSALITQTLAKFLIIHPQGQY